MENMEMMNNAEVVEEVVEVPVENYNNGLKKALVVGGIVLAGFVLYKKVIKPAMRKKKASDDSNDRQVNNKPEGMRATETVDSFPKVS